jgi:hypothetical protein
MQLSTATTEAEIIAFPTPPARVSNRMTVRDRIEALRWSDTAATLGYTRVLLDTSDHDRDLELGDFMLVYRPGATWASWGIGCTTDGFMLWCPQTGVTIGRFKTLTAALERIQALT